MFIAALFYTTALLLSFPFPHEYPYGEAVFLAFNIPIRMFGGLHVLGIVTLVVFIVSLHFLAKSLEKYHVRLVIVAIILFNMLPSFLIDTYQETFATGIYAVSYNRDSSSCEFDLINANTLRGKCELYLENHSENDVKFLVGFFDPWKIDDLEMETLMNDSAPYDVLINGNASKRVEIVTEIDVSDMKSHITNGEASGVHIMMMSGEKVRNL